MTVQGPVKEQQPDGMSHRGLAQGLGISGGGGGEEVEFRCGPQPPQSSPPPPPSLPLCASTAQIRQRRHCRVTVLTQSHDCVGIKERMPVTARRPVITFLAIAAGGQGGARGASAMKVECGCRFVLPGVRTCPDGGIGAFLEFRGSF